MEKLNILFAVGILAVATKIAAPKNISPCIQKNFNADIHVERNKPLLLLCTSCVEARSCAFKGPHNELYVMWENATYESGRITAHGANQSECGVRVTELQEKDNGIWECIISTQNGSVSLITKETFDVTVLAGPQQEPHSLGAGLIVSIGLAIVAAFVLISCIYHGRIYRKDYVFGCLCFKNHGKEDKTIAAIPQNKNGGTDINLNNSQNQENSNPLHDNLEAAGDAGKMSPDINSKSFVAIKANAGSENMNNNQDISVMTSDEEVVQNMLKDFTPKRDKKSPSKINRKTPQRSAEPNTQSIKLSVAGNKQSTTIKLSVVGNKVNSEVVEIQNSEHNIAAGGDKSKIDETPYGTTLESLQSYTSEVLNTSF